MGQWGAVGEDIHKHTSIMQNSTVGVKNKWIDEEFIWKTEQETKKSQESLRGQEDSEQSSKVLTTDRIRARSNNKSRKTVQPSENAHGLLSHCWWGNQPSYTISK